MLNQVRKLEVNFNVTVLGLLSVFPVNFIDFCGRNITVLLSLLHFTKSRFLRYKDEDLQVACFFIFHIRHFAIFLYIDSH